MLETKNNKIMKSVKQLSMWVLWLAVIAAFPAIALADEVWSSNVGEIFYEKDAGSTAIFQYPTPGKANSKRRLFINRYVLDGNGKRGTYFGYWTDDNNNIGCEASVTDELGNKTNAFGRLTIKFTNETNGFWDFEAAMGTCFGEKVPSIRAKSSNTASLTPTPPPISTNGRVPRAVTLKLQSDKIPLSKADPAYSVQKLDIFPAIFLEVEFTDGTVGKFPDYQKDFATNIVFDDVANDPNDIIQVVYWDDGKGGKYPAQLTSTGKGVGIAYLTVAFRNAPGVTAYVKVEVVSGR